MLKDFIIKNNKKINNRELNTTLYLIKICYTLFKSNDNTKEKMKNGQLWISN